MNKPTHTLTTTNPAPTPPRPGDFTAPDGLVKVRTKSTGLRRWPQHDYPCVVLEVHPQAGTRIQALPGGGLEAMLRHSELRALLEAINAAAGQEIYLAKEVKDKPTARKEHWERINAQRYAERQAATTN